MKPSLFVMRRSEDRPEIEWPCRTRISCHHLVWAALGIDPRSAPGCFSGGYHEAGVSVARLADTYGRSRNTINEVVKGWTDKNVKEDPSLPDLDKQKAKRNGERPSRNYQRFQEQSQRTLRPNGSDAPTGPLVVTDVWNGQGRLRGRDAPFLLP